MEHYASALRIAGELGDQGSEADLAWTVAVFCDEVGQRDQAIRLAQTAVDIYQRLGAPQIATYADCLERFRRGAADWNRPMAEDAAAQGLGQSVRPPSPLRMAYTAAKAMAKFVASGFKTVSREAHERRLATCGDCEHHTGLRRRLCGCFTSQKAWLPHEHCPARRWPV